MNEIGLQSLGGQTTFQPGAGFPRHKAQGHAGAVQLCQYSRHVDSFAAQYAIFPCRTVDRARLQRCVKAHHIVNGRIEGNGINHRNASFVACFFNTHPAW